MIQEKERMIALHKERRKNEETRERKADISCFFRFLVIVPSIRLWLRSSRCLTSTWHTVAQTLFSYKRQKERRNNYGDERGKPTSRPAVVSRLTRPRFG